MSAPRKKNKNTLLLIGLLLGLPALILPFSCEKEEDPGAKLKNAELVSLLAELHVAEAALQHLPATGTVKDSMAGVYYDQVLGKYQMTRENYEKMMVKLRTDPQRLQMLYEQVVDSLTEMEKRSDN